MNSYLEISFEDKMKIADFKLICERTLNPNNEITKKRIIDALFDNVAFYYAEYRGRVPFISASKEKYKFHILQPVDGKYSLLDFLINRAVQNVELIVFGKGNSYSVGHKRVRINLERYADCYDRYSNDRIRMLYLKSALHETGHALHTWDGNGDSYVHIGKNSEDDPVHAVITDKVKIAEERSLFRIYKNILRMSDIPSLPQKTTDINTFQFYNLNVYEAATEYFACKRSGLFGDIDQYETIFMVHNTPYVLMAPSRTNGYQHCIRFIYHLDNVVSKEALFDSVFFDGDEALQELSKKYAHIVERVWKRNSDYLQETKENTNSKVLLLFRLACMHDDKHLNAEDKESKVIAQCTLDMIFYEIYREEFEKGNIPKEKMKEIVKYAYTLSPAVLNSSDHTFKDLTAKLLYSEWERELNGESIPRSTKNNKRQTDHTDR